MVVNCDVRSEIAFFDVETTVPTRSCHGFSILEFGAILVCPRKLVELRNYSTLVRPADLSHITSLSVRCNGITKDAVVSAPTFADISDMVYDLLHGRIWAGHNILRFDCARIREAFAASNRPAPEPRGTIDSLALLTQKFGRRAGDMKMATLATYFGLGQQTHRSLDDVRMNLEVLKYCATVLFLESSLPNILTENSLISPNPATTDIFNMAALSEEIENEPLPEDSMEEEKTDSSSQDSSTSVGFEDNNDFLDADDTLIPSISVTLAPFFHGTQKIHILHQNLPLQLRCGGLKVRFGISTKFVDHAGRPRLSFVVNPSSNLCMLLETTDSVAQKVSVDSGSSSEWRPVVNRKPGFLNFPTIRLHLPTIADGEITGLATEIYQKDGSTVHRLSFSRFDVVELESIFTPGNLVDAFFSLDAYDYQQNAGIRLVAKKLILHSR